MTARSNSFWLTLLLFGSMTSCVPSERPDGDSKKAKVHRATPEAVRRNEDIPDPNDKPVPALEQSDTSLPASKLGGLKNGQLKRLGESVKAQSGDGSLDPLLTQVFVDSFDRDQLGDAWLSTSPGWRLEEGRLCVQDAHNHPLWLKRRLPKNARIEFVVTPYSEEGDVKVEIWGDGRSAATGTSYRDATSYIAIFGGWKNQFHVLARLDEHAPNRPEIRLDPNATDLRARPVQPEVEYAFKIERSDGKAIRWLVDDIEIFNFNDPAPLVGPGHDHFAFNNWQVRACFDKLKITPLGE